MEIRRLPSICRFDTYVRTAKLLGALRARRQELVMSLTRAALSRRTVMQIGIVRGLALVFQCPLRGALLNDPQQALFHSEGQFEPNAFNRIDGSNRGDYSWTSLSHLKPSITGAGASSA